MENERGRPQERIVGDHLEFPNAVVLNTVRFRNTQISAKERTANEHKRAQTKVRKRTQTQVRKRVQKSVRGAKERFCV